MNDLELQYELAQSTPTLHLKSVYGMRTEVKGNCQFLDGTTIFFPIEGMLVLHDIKKNKQRFLRFAEDTTVVLISLNPTRKLLAAVERIQNLDSILRIYDMPKLSICRELSLPEGITHDLVAELHFTLDSKAIFLLSKPPNEQIFMYTLDEKQNIYEIEPTINFNAAMRPFTSITCSSFEREMFAICAGEFILLMHRKKDQFLTFDKIKCQRTLVSCDFIRNDCLIAGSEDGFLVVVESGEFRFAVPASELRNFDTLWEQERIDKELEIFYEHMWKPEEPRVLLMTVFATGFAYVIYNKVFVFKKITQFKFERQAVIVLSMNLHPPSWYQIKEMSIDMLMESVIVVPKHAQVFISPLFPVDEIFHSTEFKFQPVGPLQHNAEIVSMSVCAGKPIVMTASRDSTLRIWNYETDALEFMRRYPLIMNLVNLHPTGSFAAIGFSDQVRTIGFYLQDCIVTKTYNYPDAKDVKYSNYGHLLATACHNLIYVNSAYQFNTISILKKHNGTVLSLVWTRCDKYLLTGDSVGAIYQWNPISGERIQEFVQKGTEYRALCATWHDPLQIYAVTQYGFIRAFKNPNKIREISPNVNETVPLTDVCLSHSDLVMFISNEAGDIFNVKLPIMDSNQQPCTHFRFFRSSISRILLSYDGTRLFAVTKAGTIAVFNLSGLEHRIEPIESDLLKGGEILVPRIEMENKLVLIKTLELRLTQQVEEFAYMKTQNEIFGNQKLAMVHRDYVEAIEELKKECHDVEVKQTDEINAMTFHISDLNEEQRKKLEKASNLFKETMVLEYHKYHALENRKDTLKSELEAMLKKRAGELQDMVEGMEMESKQILDKRKELIRQLIIAMDNKRTEFGEYCRRVDEEHDQYLASMEIKYKDKIKNAKEKAFWWRGRSGLLIYQYQRLVREWYQLEDQAALLDENIKKATTQIDDIKKSIEAQQKEILDREFTIGSQETQIIGLLRINQEREKRKDLSLITNGRLKAEFEPIEESINELRRKEEVLEEELETVKASSDVLDKKLSVVLEKLQITIDEEDLVRKRAVKIREKIHVICTDIYHAINKTTNPRQLKIDVKRMYRKYAGSYALPRQIEEDKAVLEEFEKQRAYAESVVRTLKPQYNSNRNCYTLKKYKQRMHENDILFNELGEQRDESKNIKSYVKHLSEKSEELREILENLKITEEKQPASKWELLRDKLLKDKDWD